MAQRRRRRRESLELRLRLRRPAERIVERDDRGEHGSGLTSEEADTRALGVPARERGLERGEDVRAVSVGDVCLRVRLVGTESAAASEREEAQRERVPHSGSMRPMVPEAPLEPTEHGLVAKGEGWYVVNARETRWYHAEGRSAFCDFEGDQDFKQLGINVQVLEPGVFMSMYHWEADQEDFLVVAGEALLIIEGEERPLRQWDFVHCPPDAKHTIVGAGSGPCVVVAVGAREHQDGPGWGGYTVDEVALRHGAGVKEETTDAQVAYAPFTRRRPTDYQDWLPDR